MKKKKSSRSKTKIPDAAIAGLEQELKK